MDIDKLLNDLRGEKADCIARADNFKEAWRKAEHEAEIIAAHIQGVEEGRGLAPAANAVPTRRERRDIRAMVQAELPNLETAWPPSERVRVLSNRLDCRPSQVRHALRAIDGETVA